MKVICMRSYVCEKTKEIIFTNKKEYECAYPEDSNGVIHIWVLDNSNQWIFFTKKSFDKYFITIEQNRKIKLDEIFKG